jgi:hypothetical protein
VDLPAGSRYIPPKVGSRSSGLPPTLRRRVKGRACTPGAKTRTLAQAGNMSMCTTTKCRFCGPPNKKLALFIVACFSSFPTTYTHSELALHINTIVQRRRFDMLRGFSGSASPSQVTRYGCSVTTPGWELFGRVLSGSASKHV